MAKRRITKTTPHDSRETVVFWCRKSRQNSNWVIFNGDSKSTWGRLNACAVAENWRLSTRSVVNLVRSQVYQTERPSYLFAARLPWCSASCGFVSDSRSCHFISFQISNKRPNGTNMLLQHMFYTCNHGLIILLRTLMVTRLTLNLTSWTYSPTIPRYPIHDETDRRNAELAEYYWLSPDDSRCSSSLSASLMTPHRANAVHLTGTLDHSLTCVFWRLLPHNALTPLGITDLGDGESARNARLDTVPIRQQSRYHVMHTVAQKTNDSPCVVSQ